MSKFDSIYKGLLKLVKEAGPGTTKKVIEIASIFPGGMKGLLVALGSAVVGVGFGSYKLGANKKEKELLGLNIEEYIFEVSVFENDNLKKQILINSIDSVKKYDSSFEILFRGVEYYKRNEKEYKYSIDKEGNCQLLILNTNTGEEIDFDYQGLSDYVNRSNSNLEDSIIINKMEV